MPRMSDEGAECMAAAFRSAGVNARVSPPSDEETLNLAARFTTGEECLPQRVTLGNFLKIILHNDFNPHEHAFFMPTSAGPCRFGQYAPLLKRILREMDYEDAIVFSPTSSDGYEGISTHKKRFFITGWRALVVSDGLRKLLFMFRPYEKNRGETDTVFNHYLKCACEILSNGSISLSKQLSLLAGICENARDDFLKIKLDEEPGSRPVIGVVGEIFLRFNSFSNQSIIRKIEKAGGEVWITGITEWVYYTNYEQKRRLDDINRRFGLSMLNAHLRNWWQRRDEKRILAPFRFIFKERPEPHIETILKYSHPYLPAEKALGEMTLNTGNAIAFHKAGCDGVVDISPFTCMNGIVTEAIYPNVTHDLGGFPIRIFYFDGVPFDLDRDLEIFMELVQSQRKKRLFVSCER